MLFTTDFINNSILIRLYMKYPDRFKYVIELMRKSYSEDIILFILNQGIENTYRKY